MNRFDDIVIYSVAELVGSGVGAGGGVGGVSTAS